MRHMQAFVVSLVTGALAVAAPGSAHAQAVANPVAEPVAEPKMWAGGHLGLSPIGTLKADAMGMSASNDAATAFEIGGRFEYQVAPLISIGVAPAILFGVKAKDANDSASQLDLPLRIAVGGEVAPKVRLYGFAAPGYSILFPPSDANGNTTHPSGFMIGFGGGVGYRVAPTFMIAGELGYQFRFWSETVNVLGTSIDVSAQDDFLTFGIAATAGF
jgi:outer membrane protein with beta-barrel domain